MDHFDVDVDVLCIGSGPASMVAAIAAADAGRVVLVAKLAAGHAQWHSASRPGRSWTVAMRNALSSDGLSAETLDYLHDVTSGVDPPRSTPGPVGLPRRSIAASREIFGPVPPFRGTDVIEWNHACLNSRFGLVYTRISLPGARELTTATGGRIEVSVIEGAPDDWSVVSPSAWLAARARACGVLTMQSDSLRHLVFDDDGRVVGAALGSEVIRAHDGVALGTVPQQSDDSVLREAWTSSDARLGLTSAVASRFGRLELMTSEAAKPASSQRKANYAAVVRSPSQMPVGTVTPPGHRSSR